MGVRFTQDRGTSADRLPPRPGQSQKARRLLKIRAYIALTKPRVMELLLVATAPTMILAARGLPNIWLFAGTIVGGAASAGSAAVFNMYVDRDIDAQMKRTSWRPLVTGEVTPRAALIFAWALGIGSTIWFLVFTNPLAAALSVGAIFWYVVVYTLVLKRRTAQNIVWGGIAGAFPVLIAWAATTGTLGWPAIVLFLLIFLWTPAHYWPLSVKYKADYVAAGVPMLGAVADTTSVGVRVVIYALATVLSSLALIPIADMGPVYTLGSIGLGVWFVADAMRFVLASRSPRRRQAARPMRVFHTSNVFLSLLFVAIAVDALLPR